MIRYDVEKISYEMAMLQSKRSKDRFYEDISNLKFNKSRGSERCHMIDRKRQKNTTENNESHVNT